MANRSVQTDFSFGPDVNDQGTIFRLWAPSAKQVQLRVLRSVPPVVGGETVPEGSLLELPLRNDGWCSSDRLPLGAGSRYAFKINGELEVPDPASRRQSDGVHGPSEVVDLRAIEAITGTGFLGRGWEETILYELHLGTFSESGGFSGLTERLSHLEELGVTALELMPIAAFPGSRNWGYDGVLPYAPAEAYGSPEELATLIRRSHDLALTPFLDVVYNHFGPEGNYLHLYAAPFFTDRFETPWGAAIDFSLPEVRRFFLENALYWTLIYGFDGLRIDAVHAIRDPSTEHFVDELARKVREAAAVQTPGRQVHVILENEENEAHRIPPATAQWNDDVHHLIHVLITGESEGYYQDYQETPHGNLGKTLTEGFYFQGGPSRHRGGKPRGENSTDLPPTAFVAFSHNHDQIGNRALGERPTTLVPRRRAMEAVEKLILLSPQTPMLFMGEEWGSERPFLFFCDYTGDLAEAVREGRRKEFSGFAAFRDEESRKAIPDPNDPETFRSSRLDWSWKDSEGGFPREREELIQGLLALRMSHLTPLLPQLRSGSWSGGGEEAVRLRWPGMGGLYWTLYFNLTDQERRLPAFDPPRKSRSVYTEGSEVEPGAPLPAWSVVATVEEE